MSAASKVPRAVRTALLVAVPVAAIAAAWWYTRPAPAGSGSSAASQPNDMAGMEGHDHASMARPSGTAQSVTLTAEQVRRIGVTFAEVTASALPRDIRTVGQVTVDETRLQTIAPKVEGWVERLYVDFTGRAISRGEPLMAIYSPALVAAQEELLLARRLASDMSQAAPEARADAEELLQSARRRLSYWDIPAADIERIERSGQVQRTLTLRATASGVVTEKNVTHGQRIMAGDALFRVADLSTVWVEGDVYEQDLRAVRVGQQATAEFDAFAGERFTGRIAYIYPTLAPETRTARVRVSLPNPGQRLKPGMYATLRIVGSAASATMPVLTVPRSAVLSTGERSIVFVKRENGQLEPREVQIGATSDDRIEIISGVALGDIVVASATFLVDAESNLGTALGGMGDMPGMEITTPPTRSTPRK